MAWRSHSAYPDASCMGLAPWGGAGILTGFPFGMLQLGHALGPANPRLTNIAVEPLAPPVVGILTRLCCYFHRDPRPCAVHWTSRPSFYPRTAPPYPISFRSARVSAAGLAPSIFGARSLGG